MVSTVSTPIKKKITVTAEQAAIASRLVTFRVKYAKLTQEELREEAGITTKTLSFYENGWARPGSKLVTLLTKKYGLSSDWLFTGRGEPQKRDKAKPDSIANMQVRIAMLERQVGDLQKTLNAILEKLS
ncbi:MAG TPA: helix-turn-helix transcriptional regulator [Sphingobacteriaceae bacterium]